MTRRWTWLLLALATLPAAFPLWQDGFFASSDGMIHLYRLFELDGALRAGILYPRWFPLAGYGYGLPVLNYYPPLTYYLAEAFHLLGAGYIAAIKWLIAASLLIAAFSMFLLARDWLSDGASFVAALAYAYSPYLLSDAYVRGNFPEMLAMSLLPLALWAVAQVQWEVGRMKDEERGILGFSLRISRLAPLIFSFAAIMLAHHLTALQFAALLLVYVGFLFGLESHQPSASGDQRSAVSRLCARLVAILVALALTAFYWVPALGELNLVYVEAASLARFLVNRLISPFDFFTPSLAYTYLPQSEALTRAFGFPQTMLALLAGVVVLWSVLTHWLISSLAHWSLAHWSFGSLGSKFRVEAIRTTPHASRFTLYIFFFFLLVACSIFMTLTPAAPLWYALPILRFMQFPWRFQILAAIGIAFLLGVWAHWLADGLGRARIQRTVYPAFALALIGLSIVNLPLRAFPLTDAQVDLTRADDSAYVVAQMGWGWTREFVPTTTREFDAIYTAFVKTQPIAPAPPRALPSVTLQSDNPHAPAFRILTAEPFELSLHVFYFPGWQAYVDDAPTRTYPRGGLGLVSATVPPGDHVVRFRFEETWLRRGANLVSLLAFGAMMVCLFFARRRVAFALLAALVLLGALLIQTWKVSKTFQVCRATLDARVTLIGYKTERAQETLFVTLHWLALQEFAVDYASFAHLVDAQGALIAQSDGTPDQGLTPTTRWIPGEVITDRRALSLREAAPGDYRIIVGMYLPREDGFQNLGAPIELGTVRVE